MMTAQHLERPRVRALLLTYVFPPTGGVGTERVRKLAKYLPDHDIDPVVLTALNPSVPLIDRSAERDIRPGLRILRARTLEPSYSTKRAVWASTAETVASADRTLKGRARTVAALVARKTMIPDPQVLWQPDVHRVLARELYRRTPNTDVVFITAPPFSSFLAAPIARLRGRTAVVLDYRDEWQTTRTSYEMTSGTVAAVIGDLLEANLLRCAHAITTATDAFRDNLLERFPFIDPSRVVAIPNGYDPDDFPKDLPDPPLERFVMTYAGTIYKLTSPRGFLQAVKILHEREPELARLLEVRFVGRIVETEADAFDGMKQFGVCCTGFVEKDRVAAELNSSHVVLCFLDHVPGTERIHQAKVFELMYLGRPVLAMAPDGALKELIRRHKLGAVVPPRDAPRIAEHLANMIRAWRVGQFPRRSEAVDIERYDRRSQAAAFADIFRAAIARART
jgi:glycosyltransferase involved in cell wall biosynthesis